MLLLRCITDLLVRRTYIKEAESGLSVKFTQKRCCNPKILCKFALKNNFMSSHSLL